MADLLTNPKRSIITQSYAAKERLNMDPLNADGFGIGWYVDDCNSLEISSPCVFCSTHPAWNNSNLRRLAPKIKSNLLFAHVRAAWSSVQSEEDQFAMIGAVSEANCHPFQHGKFMFMHNGCIGDYGLVRRKCRESLSDECFGLVKGTTDSEMLFWMFMDSLMKDFDISAADCQITPAQLCDKLLETFSLLKKFGQEVGVTEASILNVAVTDGKSVVCTRYADQSDAVPASLYYASGSHFSSDLGEYVMKQEGKGNMTTIIASEPLTDRQSDWILVPANHVIVVSEDDTVLRFPIDGESPISYPILCQESSHVLPDTEVPKSQNFSGHLHAGNWFTLSQHTETVLSLGFWGNLLFTGCSDGTIGIWNPITWKCDRILEGHRCGVQSIVFSKDLMFSASNDGTIKVWDAYTFSCKATFDLHSGKVFCLTIGNQNVYAGCQGASLNVIDFSPFGNTSPQALNYHLSGYAIALETLGDLICCGSGDGTILLFETTENEFCGILTGHRRSITSLRVLSELGEGRKLSSGSSDGNIKLWDLNNPQEGTLCIWSLKAYRGPVTALSSFKTVLFSAGSETTAFTEFAIKAWDTKTCSLLLNFPLSDKCKPIYCLQSFEFKEGVVLAAGSGTTVVSWSITGFNEVGDDCERGLGILTPTSSNDIWVSCSSRESMVQLLRDFVRFKSVSVDPSLLGECFSAAKFLCRQMELIGISSKLVQYEGGNPVVIGKLWRDPNLPTILIYGHYDVVPCCPSEEECNCLSHFDLIGKNGFLYGRGAVDAKGPIIATLFAVKEVLSESDGKDNLGVNILFLYEGEEEARSRGVVEAMKEEGWLPEDTVGKAVIDVVLIMNTYWIGTVPCLTYGLRGVIDFNIEISGLREDLHSGLDGGSCREPFHEMTYLLSHLVDPTGAILAPGFYDDVRPVTKEEEDSLSKMDFDMGSYSNKLGVKLSENNVKDLLMKRWCLPSVSVYQVTSDGGSRIISKSVQAKVGIRTVPDQKTKGIFDRISTYLHKLHANLDSSNKLSIELLHSGEAWIGDRHSKFYHAAALALEEVWKVKPVFVREGGSIPLTNVIESATKAPVLHLPIGHEADRAHLDNERISLENFLNAKDVLKKLFKGVGLKNSWDYQRNFKT